MSRLFFNGSVLVAILGLPLVGAIFAGRPVAEFTEFPPRVKIPADYLKFSWWAAGAVVACVVALGIPWVRKGVRDEGMKEESPGGTWPGWGWAAVVWALAWWGIAWTRFEIFAGVQRYTFFPLWLGFIVSLNALVVQRTGSSLMTRAPRRWLVLFVASALCWWGFEWLNRFVLNWHYLGAEEFGPVGYAVHATFCFSTVLPAVAAIAEWIGSHRGWMRRVQAGPRWSWMARRKFAVLLMVAGIVALLGTGFWPRWFYPALWVAPLAFVLGVRMARNESELARELAAGDWTRAATWMIAALVCGFFWEMWNFLSSPKWIYTVPAVERWFVFEMPLLGYAGYLPFGLECLLASEAVIRTDARSGSPSGPAQQV